MDVTDLKAFLRVAELGSVSAAARALALPKSNVSRAVTRLEQAVGAALLDRSPRHLRLTDAGLLFRPHAARILADIEEATAALGRFGGAPRGTLRVSVPFTLAVAVVSPMVPAFLARNPEVQLILDVENRLVDMPAEAVDVAIRVGTLPDSDLIARRLMTVEMWTCASPGYLAVRGVPAEVADLHEHELISGFARPVPWSYGTGPDRLTLDVGLNTAICEPAALERVLAGGAGIGRLPDFLAADPVARGDLVRLFPELEGDRFDVHALYTSHRGLSAKVRAFIDALVASLAIRAAEPRAAERDRASGS